MKRIHMLLIATSFALSNASVDAATLSGSTVDFTFDDTELDALLASYSVIGDTLSFKSTGFDIQLTNIDIDIVRASTPSITISAKPGHILTALNLSELGDYFRIETSENSTFLGVAGQFSVNNQTTYFTPDQLLNNTATPSSVSKDGQFLMPWTVSETIGLNNTESLTVNVKNILVAGVFSNLNAVFIEANLIKLGVETVPAAVPVPAAFWMFGSSLLGMLITGRRKMGT